MIANERRCLDVLSIGLIRNAKLSASKVNEVEESRAKSLFVIVKDIGVIGLKRSSYFERF